MSSEGGSLFHVSLFMLNNKLCPYNVTEPRHKRHCMGVRIFRRQVVHGYILRHWTGALYVLRRSELKITEQEDNAIAKDAQAGSSRACPAG